MDKITLLHVNTKGLLELYNKEFNELLDLFYSKSDSEGNKERILGLIDKYLESPLFKLYFVLDKDFFLVAYYILQLGMNTDAFEPECFVYQHCSKIGFIQEANKILEEKIAELGVKRVKFITKRNAEAFLRSLKDSGFKITGTVVEKRIGG